MPPPTTKKSLKNLQELQKTLEDPRPNTIVITGQAGAGKTSMAATLFGKDVAGQLANPSQTKNIVLKGAVWILADEQGIVSLTSKRIRPEFVLDLTTLMSEAGGKFSVALLDLYAYLKEAKELGATAMVVDTVTSFGGQWLVPNFVDGNENGFTGWQQVANSQSRLLQVGHALELRQVWLAQPAENKLEAVAQSNKGTELDKAKAVAQSVGGGSNYVVPAIAGKAFPPILNAQCSLSGWLRAKTRNGKRVREFLPYGGDGAQGKTRYEGVLEQREDPDLWAMDQKILKATGNKA